MTNALTTTNGTGAPGAVTLMPFSDEERKAIMATVAKGCSPAEFTMLMRISLAYGLDPFLKEIWAIKRNEREPAMIMTSRDGYLKVAQRDPEFDGLKGATVCENDEFSFDPVTPAVTHRIGHPRGKIVGAWAMACHKRRQPVAMFVEFSEYKGSSPIWQKYPSAMILKVAEVLVLKRQVGISGLVTYEEVDSDSPATRAAVVDVQNAVREVEAEAAARKGRLENAAHRYGLEWADVGRIGRAKYGATVTVADLTDAQVSDLETKWIPEEAHRRNEPAPVEHEPIETTAELVEAEVMATPLSTYGEAPVMPTEDDDFDL